MLDNPLAFHITGKLCHDVRFVTTDKSHRQPFQTGKGVLQIVPSTEKDDLRHIFALNDCADIANDRKFRHHIDRHVSFRPAANHDMRIKLGNSRFQFRFHDRFDGTIGPVEGINRQTDEQVFHHVTGTAEVFVHHLASHSGKAP